MWYSRLRSSSVSSFDQLTKEFELNFWANARPKPIATSLLGLSQKDDEPLAQFITCFVVKIRGVPNMHPSLVMQAFWIGRQPSRFFWSLIERSTTTIPEMLEQANHFIAIEVLVVGKREDHKRPRTE
ncbi:hypothetical protein GW17_00042801 [Ensete ventricosum]|nr:hypothetical protein GW17_00042801 [Ensete ventricosum]RZS03008.1 hypothetical protein BHM03_00033133 [Ensete ventricosum]